MKSARTLSLILALACALPGFAQKRTINIASYDYLPFNGHGLKDDGAITKLTAMVFEKAGYTVKVNHHDEPWARILAEAQAGDFDALVSVWESKEREAYLAITDPIMNNDVGFFAMKADGITAGSAKALEDAKLTVGAVRGYAMPKPLAGTKLAFDYADSDEALVKKFVAGREKVILTDKAVGLYFAGKQGADLPGKMQWLFSAESTPLRTGVVKAGKADWPTVVKDYNTALAGLVKDGTVAKVLKEYGLR